MSTAHPIIVVTGANSGVGFGICQRLLFQLCHRVPSDSLPQGFVLDAPKDNGEPVTYEGLTLIMACRNAKSAESARGKLMRKLDGYVNKLKRAADYNGHAEEFRRNVQIDIIGIELSMLSTVFKFADEVNSKYPYVSHIVCNAGVVSFTGIDWISCFKQLFTDPIATVTAPVFYLQTVGDLSIDGLGWAWQCNLFGHYVLFRSLTPSLQRTPSNLTGLAPRVIWTSSCAASPDFYDPEDWQLKKTEHAYQSSKYEIDILCTTLDHRAQWAESKGERPIRHFVTQPGICSTNVARDVAGPVLDIFKVLLFYLVRFLGSPNHPIWPFKAAIGAVHLCLAPLTFISLLPSSNTEKGHENGHVNGSADSSVNGHAPILREANRLGAETDCWGTERVGITPVKEWENHKQQGKELAEKCENLYESFKMAAQPTVDEPVE